MDIRRRTQIGGIKKTSSGGGSTAGGSYTVNLNSQWETTTVVPNPDSTLYDGVYRSSSNYNVNSGVAIMYITIKDCSSFKMYIRSYADSNYDYVMVSQLDQTINGNTSYSNTTLVKAHTRGNQQSGTLLSSYTLVEFTGISSGQHTITVVYRKDGSAHSGDDRGYVLIEKTQAGGGEDEGGSSEGVINIDNYLTIEALEDRLTAKLSKNACEYCVDGDGNWKSLAAGAATQSINSGHTLSFRGNLTPNGSEGIGTFTISKKCNLKGNCMSMLFRDNASDNYSLSGYNSAFRMLFNSAPIVEVSTNFLPATQLASDCYRGTFYTCPYLKNIPNLPATTLVHSCYRGMFYECTSLTSVTNLPATTLAPYCYNAMFSRCTKLTTIPSLPVTTLAEYCYASMFQHCTSLTTTPELPATILKPNCYQSMFYGCTSLTTAPTLPATTLVDGCYYTLFYKCSKLNYIKMLATDISASNCFHVWVEGVSSSGTFVKNPTMTTLPTGVSGIPNGWTVVNDGEPVININKYLTIEALEDGLTASLSVNTCEYCVNGNGNWKSLSAGTATESINTGQTLSFRGELTPTSSNGIGTFSISKKCNLKGNCMSMLFGDNAVSNTSLNGKSFAFYKLFSNCSNIVTVNSHFLPATVVSSACYDQMFMNCTSLTTAPELPTTTLQYRCYRDMFLGCTNLTTVPSILPATTLADGCYQSMFYNCTSLTTAPELPATTLVNYCYNHMFYACYKLNYIKMLATDISALNCLSSWVYYVASSGTFVKNPAMTTLPTGSSGIPSGWTVVNDGEESGGSSLTFPVTLVNGDNGEIGKLVFEYCKENHDKELPNGGIILTTEYGNTVYTLNLIKSAYMTYSNIVTFTGTYNGIYWFINLNSDGILNAYQD